MNEFLQNLFNDQYHGIEGEYAVTAFRFFKNNFNLLLDTYLNAFKFSGISPEISTEVLINLVTDGFSITDAGPEDLRTCTGAISGLDFYGRPKKAAQVNHTIERSKVKQVYYEGENTDGCCVVARTTPYENGSTGWHPLGQVLAVYAAKMTNADISIQSAMYNSRMAVLFMASDPEEVEEFKRIYKKVSLGEPAVMLNDNGIMTDYNRIQPFPVQSVASIDKLFDAKDRIKNEFLEWLGVPVVPYEKKERLVSGEVDNPYSEIRNNCLLSVLRKWAERCNKVFGTNIVVENNYNRGGAENAATDEGFTDSGDTEN